MTATRHKPQRLYLGIDVGTAGTKAMVVNADGAVYGRGHASYELDCPEPGHAVQDVADWRNAVTASTLAACAGVDADQIVSLALSAQGGTLVAIDKRHEPLGPARSWLDRRATASAATFERIFGTEDFYRRTGWPISSNNTAPQLLDLASNDPEQFAAASCFCDTAAYVNGWLTGTPLIDANVAGISQLMNVSSRSWDEDVLAAIGVGADRLPAIALPGAAIGTLTPEASTALGLHPGTVVGAGAQDQYCAALGADAIGSGDLLISTGTAWVMLVAAAERYRDPGVGIGTGRHLGEQLWGHFGEVSNGGASIEWARRLLTHGDHEPIPIDELDAVLANTSTGADGLSFYPFFDGTGLPDGAESSLASMLGLSLSHRHEHVLRAVVEGVAFAMRMLLDRYNASVNQSSVSPTVVGGATRSRQWMQILADILDQDLRISSDPDVACIGAAALAATAIGDTPNAAAAAARMTPAKSIISAKSCSTAEYDRLFAIYETNARALDELYASRAGIPRKELA